MMRATAVLVTLLLATSAFAQPDMSVGAKEYPDADAIILSWTQNFTLEKDGTIRRREHKWIKILDARAIRGFADPRIDFCEGEDEVIVHKAVTHLPDGKVMPVPDYSYNIAAPRDVAGWPLWSNWRQKIVSFSGLQPGAVIEFDYEVVTKAGVVPYLSAELRLDADHPVLRHEVVVTVPSGLSVSLWSEFGSLWSETSPKAEKTERDGRDIRRWVARDLPARRAEPQSLPWRERCSVLAFTTCSRGWDWARGFTCPIEVAAKADDAIQAFAEEAVGNAVGAEARIDAVIRRLRETTHLVDSGKTWRSRRCRSAAEVFKTSYGNPLEIAALATASLRSVGFEVGTGVAVIDVPYEDWDALDCSEFDAAFAGCVLMVGNEGETLLVHPKDGVLNSYGRFGGHCVLVPEEQDNFMGGHGIGHRGDIDWNVIDLDAHVSIDAKGKVSGRVEIRLTGLFYDPADLKTADAQKALLQKIVERLVTGAKVEGIAIRTLSDEKLVAVVTFGLKKPLEKTDGMYLLELGNGPAFLPDTPMPLARSVRRTDVRLKGAFDETVDLVIELPEGAEATILPAGLAKVEGEWGTIVQTVEREGRKVHLKRRITDVPATIAAEDFPTLREAVNTLRATACRILAIRPK
jgi:Domain of Unknown Function with PDB structure (DUF3857)